MPIGVASESTRGARDDARGQTARRKDRVGHRGEPRGWTRRGDRARGRRRDGLRDRSNDTRARRAGLRRVPRQRGARTHAGHDRRRGGGGHRRRRPRNRRALRPLRRRRRARPLRAHRARSRAPRRVGEQRVGRTRDVHPRVDERSVLGATPRPLDVDVRPRRTEPRDRLSGRGADVREAACRPRRHHHLLGSRSLPPRQLLLRPREVRDEPSRVRRRGGARSVRGHVDRALTRLDADRARSGGARG